jgi:glucose-6-phosphate dehydrogenase assembly protein OpcA
MAASTIDVRAIEKELTSLWQQASSDEESGVLRSSTLNLLVYVPAGIGEDVRGLDDVLTDITSAHPCRAVLMIVDRQRQEAQISAEVTSRCTLPAGPSKQLCCEQVTITASGSQVNEVPSAISPLLIPDLPVYLWWRAVPRIEDRSFFGKLVDLSDRVIIDSARFNAPVGDLASLAAVLQNTPSWTAISDLNWARLTAWRALLSSFYDVNVYRPLLARLSRIVIEHSAPEGSDAPISARALLLGGWLASRLAWRLRRRGTGASSMQYTFDADGGEVTLEFRETERKIEPGRIAKIVLESAADRSAQFSVRRSTDSSRIETAVRLGSDQRSQRVLGYESLSESELISRELDILGHDRVYEQAVISAAELVARAPGP